MYLKCGTFSQQTPKVCQMHHQNNFYAQLLVLATYGTQVWFLIFVISFLCFSDTTISNVVLLVNKHQKFVKCTTKTSFKPNCSVLGLKETQVWILIFVISFLCFSGKTILSVVLLVNKHQKFVKCTTKTSFKPNCSF